MKRVLLTGMSGTGKSAVIRVLASRGHAADDLDDAAWSAWVDADGDATGALPGKGWLWREDRVGDLIAADGAGMLFVSGCASNMGPFLGRFDHVVLLRGTRWTATRRSRRWWRGCCAAWARDTGPGRARPDSCGPARTRPDSRSPDRCLRPWRWRLRRARMGAGPGADAAEPEEIACPRNA